MNGSIRRISVALLLLVPAAGAAGGPWPTGREVVALKARPFALSDVRLLDGPFRDAMERDRKYLRELEADRLLHFFRVTAGLKSSAEPMGGWEKTEVRGHTMGHFLSACAMMYASTGDEALKAKAESIVGELARCQKALGGGYLSAFPESFIDRVVACKPVWAPWYTLHKVLAGLIDVHAHCSSREALDVAQRLAGWMQSRIDKLDEPAMQRMLNTTEQGGTNEALANLFGLTGEKRWLDLSRRFVQRRYVEPLARREDRLKGEHVNSFIPNIIGTARQYELTGRGEDREIARYFWDQVTSTRCYCTGGTSNEEHWRTEPGKLAGELGDHTQETCCTYNLLKLTRHLLAWEPEARYADYYERTLINGILATQDPTTGMMMYFVPLASGRWKCFNVPRDAFWCCTGTGMENHARYGEAIYAHDGEGLWVNLFIASQVQWKDKAVRIRQETKFPVEESTALIVSADKPADFELRVRVPGWAARPVTARLNGQPLDASARPGSYLTVRRTWRDGDRLDVSLPMGLRAEPMPDDAALVALMYGPLVLAGELGGEGLSDEMVHTSQNWFRFPRDKVAAAPEIVTDEADPAAWVKPVPGQSLTFRTDGVGRPHDVTLRPYHMLFGQRYAVYWRVMGPRRWQQLQAERKAAAAREAARLAALRGRIVDEVRIGDAESETAHALKHKSSSAGTHQGRPWRHAAGGGWFSYEMKVLPDRPMCLLCTYWGSDVRRTFDVLIDGRRIATQRLQNNRPGEYYDEEYPIAAELTRGKAKVTVTFQAGPGGIAGGVFGLAMLRDEVRAMDPNVLTAERREAARKTVPEDVRKRLREANARGTAEWREIATRDDWRRLREAKLKLLRDALGPMPQTPAKLDVRTSGTVAGDEFAIENLAYQTRPGVWETANLYRPARPADSMPGLLIVHSHHNPKEQGELQDMGMTWARRGCVVLVPDMLGHGERRQHPFATAGDYDGEFRLGRQDYYFRYDTGMQLHLAGETLMGRLVWDLRRGVDVLLARPGVDPGRIVILGSVAGGGDPAAVAAALDERIGGAVIFNFGGPQPETQMPLPEDVEQRFNYAGSGSFESTRNLTRSAGDGFLPWVIVGAIAPRPLVYAHEFAWDREHDPVWKRLQKIWDLCGAPDRLAGTSGRGSVKGRPPESTHCNNIGRVHREQLHPLLKRWFGIAVGPDEEYSERRQPGELTCMTVALAAELKPKRLCDLLPGEVSRRLEAARAKQAALSAAERRKQAQADWRRVLGEIEPAPAAPAEVVVDPTAGPGGSKVERIVLTVEGGIVVPMLLLAPAEAGGKPAACVVAVAQGGKAAFLNGRAKDIAELLAGGTAVCLSDLRGTGETEPEGSRERWGEITSLSSTELMLGGSMVASRLRDLRCVLGYLRGRSDVDGKRIALWGDSFAPVNPPGRRFDVPRNADGRPAWSEPLGGWLALLGGLFDDDIAAVCVRGGLSDLQSVLVGQCVYVPHDAVVPGALTAGDLCDLAAAMAPRPLRLEALVDGLNRLRDDASARQVYRPAIEAYRKADAADRIAIDQSRSALAAWLSDALRRPAR